MYRLATVYNETTSIMKNKYILKKKNVKLMAGCWYCIYIIYTCTDGKHYYFVCLKIEQYNSRMRLPDETFYYFC